MVINIYVSLLMATGGHMVMIDGNQHICIIAHGH